MRCGRLSVEGEAEEVAALPSPRTCRLPRRQQSRNKKDGKVKGSNPYSTRGLEKFASLNEELSAKRGYVARKTGASEDLVKFIYSSKGWVPVVVKGGKSGEPRVLILRPLRCKKDIGPEETENGNNGCLKIEKNDDGCLEMEKNDNGCLEIVNKNPDNVSVPWWGYLRTTAFGVLTVSAILMRKSVVPASAMAVVMVVCALQKRWQGGVMCMKKFVLSGMSYFSDLILHWKNKMVEKDPENRVENQTQNQNRPENVIRANENKMVEKEPEKKVENQNQNHPKNVIRANENKMVEKEPEKKVDNQNQNHPENVIRASEIRKKQRGSLSLSNSLLRRNNDPHQSAQGGTKSKKECARIVSMDGLPRKPIRSDYQKSESFNRSLNPGRLKKSGVDPSVGANVVVIVLICLIFYGRLFAILATSAWWYLLPKFRTEAKNSENGDLRKMDLKHRNKKVIMDGLLDRSHNNNKNNNNGRMSI